jgi:hypothetical protein
LAVLAMPRSTFEVSRTLRPLELSFCIPQMSTIKSDYCRDISSFNSSLREFYCRDVKWDTRIFPYRSRLVPRPIVPPMDSEDVQEALRLQQALIRQS